MKRIWTTLCLGLWCATPPLHAAITVTLSTERTTVYMDEEVPLTVTIKGAQASGQPMIAGLQDFEGNYRGASTQMQIINGAFDASVIHTFAVFPKKTGTFVLGPAQIEIDGTAYKSGTITLNVITGEQKRPDDVYYYIEADVDNKQPYLNEQIIYTFRFFTRVQTTQPEVGWPKFDGFLAEPLGKEQTYQRNVGGVTWNVVELKKLLTPSLSGHVEIEGTRLTMGVVVKSNQRRGSIFDDEFFGGMNPFATQTKAANLHSPSIPIDVKPMPEQGKPSGFSGLVGHFKLEASISKTALKVGESATVTVVVSGTGNIDSATLWHDNWQKVKVYEDKPVTQNMMMEQKYGGKKEFKLAIVPSEEGALELGPLQLSFFDPVERGYKTLVTPPVRLQVTPGDPEKLSHVTAAPGGAADNKKDIKILGSDLMPPKEKISLASDALAGPEQIWLFALMGVAPGFYLGALLHQRRRLKIQADGGYERRERAHKALAKRLARAQSCGQPFPEASLALRCYLGDKFDFDGGAMTPVDTMRLLTPRGIGRATVDRLNGLLQKCDMASYGGGGVAVNKDELFEEIRLLVKTIDKEARRER